MSLHNVIMGGMRPVNQIALSHTLTFQKDQNGLAIAKQLLSVSISGAPVVDAKGRFLGFLSEFDVLTACEQGRDISQMTAEELMAPDRQAIKDSTSIIDAVRIMKTRHLLVLPVEKDGIVIGSLTRQDLLRAWLEKGLGEDALDSIAGFKIRSQQNASQ